MPWLGVALLEDDPVGRPWRGSVDTMCHGAASMVALAGLVEVVPHRPTCPTCRLHLTCRAERAAARSCAA